MAAYTKALTEAAGGDSIAKLNEAAKGFNGAAGELAGSAKAPATIGPAVGALTNLGVRLSEARRTQKIKDVMESVTSSLFTFSLRLEEDSQSVDDTLAKLIVSWDKHARCVLRASRRSGSTPQKIFLDFDTAKREILAEQARAKKGCERGYSS